MGKEIEYEIKEASPTVLISEDIDTADIKFGYCTEFIIMLEKEYGPTDEII